MRKVEWITYNVFPVVIVVCAACIVGTLLYWLARDHRNRQAAFAAEERWCAQACAQYRVLACQRVNDPAWPAPRRAAVCMLDAQGSEFKVVIDKEGAK